MSLSPEAKSAIKKIRLATRKNAQSLLSGQYRSRFRGQGMMFSEFREYVPGDDVRAISWNLLAKTGEIFTKQYEEERELNLVLVLDVSPSMNFGSRQQRKLESALTVASLLGHVATHNRDLVGLLAFTDRVEKWIPPGKGRNHLMRLLTDIAEASEQPQGEGTSIKVALEYLRSLKKRSVIFLISDFFDTRYDLELKKLAEKHDVVGVVLQDPLEHNLPAGPRLFVEDAEKKHFAVLKGTALLPDASGSKAVPLRTDLRKLPIPLIHVSDSNKLVGQLISFFKRKKR